MSDIENRLGRLESILEFSRELTSTISLQPLLDKIVGAAAELTESEAAGILLLNERADDLRFVVASHFADQLIDIPVPIEGSIAGAAFSSGKPQIVPDVSADPRYYPVVEQLTGFEARSLLAVPLQFRDCRIGVLEAENKRENGGFDEQDVETLTALAAHATVAIENARLVEALRKAHDLAEALRQAVSALSGTLDYNEVLDRVMEQMGQVISYDAANVMLIEGDTAQVLRGRGYEQFGTQSVLTSIRLDVADVAGLRRMQETGRPLAIPNVEDDPEWVYSRPEHNWIGSYAGVPIRLRDRVIGFLNVMSATPGFLSLADAERLQAFADHAAIAIENARLYHQAQQELADRVRAEKELRRHRDHLEELVAERTGELTTANEQLQKEVVERLQAEDALRRRTRELAMLNRASQAFTSTLNLDRVLATVLEAVRRLLGVVAASVWLADPESGEMICRQSVGPQSEVVRGWRLRQGRGIAGWVAQVGESLIVPDVLADERYFEQVDRRAGGALRSILTVPLRIQDDVIGVLQVADAGIDRFRPEDLTLIEPLAVSAAIAIDNARLVDALRQRTAELEERNEELDAFAHTVAHDLKSPLAHMVSFAEALDEFYDTLPDEELRRYLHTISRNGHKMSNIIDELLLLTSTRKMEKVDVDVLDMKHIVARVRQRLDYMIAEYQAEIVFPNAWPTSLGYGPWIEEVWANYMSNALKYGGQPPRMELGSTVQMDGMMRFWVRDNGPGLTTEEQTRLFTPFTRFDQVRAKGHGLGLSIVRRIVERLDGEVGVESTPGQGSEFFFTLPSAS
jgi:GAF domain-containing protein